MLRQGVPESHPSDYSDDPQNSMSRRRPHITATAIAGRCKFAKNRRFCLTTAGPKAPRSAESQHYINRRRMRRAGLCMQDGGCLTVYQAMTKVATNGPGAPLLCLPTGGQQEKTGRKKESRCPAIYARYATFECKSIANLSPTTLRAPGGKARILQRRAPEASRRLQSFVVFAKSPLPRLNDTVEKVVQMPRGTHRRRMRERWQLPDGQTSMLGTRGLLSPKCEPGEKPAKATEKKISTRNVAPR